MQHWLSKKKLKGNIKGCNLTGPGTVALLDDDWSLLIAVAWSASIENLLKPIEWRPKPGEWRSVSQILTTNLSYWEEKLVTVGDAENWKKSQYLQSWYHSRGAYVQWEVNICSTWCLELRGLELWDGVPPYLSDDRDDNFWPINLTDNIANCKLSYFRIN